MSLELKYIDLSCTDCSYDSFLNELILVLSSCAVSGNVLLNPSLYYTLPEVKPEHFEKEKEIREELDTLIKGKKGSAVKVSYHVKDFPKLWRSSRLFSTAVKTKKTDALFMGDLVREKLKRLKKSYPSVLQNTKCSRFTYRMLISQYTDKLEKLNCQYIQDFFNQAKRQTAQEIYNLLQSNQDILKDFCFEQKHIPTRKHCLLRHRLIRQHTKHLLSKDCLDQKNKKKYKHLCKQLSVLSKYHIDFCYRNPTHVTMSDSIQRSFLEFANIVDFVTLAVFAFAAVLSIVSPPAGVSLLIVSLLPASFAMFLRGLSYTIDLVRNLKAGRSPSLGQTLGPLGMLMSFCLGGPALVLIAEAVFVGFTNLISFVGSFQKLKALNETIKRSRINSGILRLPEIEVEFSVRPESTDSLNSLTSSPYTDSRLKASPLASQLTVEKQLDEAPEENFTDAPQPSQAQAREVVQPSYNLKFTSSTT